MKAKYFVVLLVWILIQLGIIKKKGEETESLAEVYPKENLIDKAIAFLRNYSFPSDYESFITYKQWNPLWRNDLIYNKTICQVGWVITSVSMALFTRGIKIDEKLVNPTILNEWLKTHEGYYQNLFFWESVSPLGLIFLNHTTNHTEIRECLQDFNCDVVLNVYSGEHYNLFI